MSTATVPDPDTLRPHLSADDSLMLCCAHRYALGRRTYIGAAVIDRLRHHWEVLHPNDRRDVVAETAEALLDDRAGDPRIDAPAWREFARWGWERLRDRQDREVVRRRLAWKLGGRSVEEILGTEGGQG